MEYYKELGVTHFIMVDNGSEDEGALPSNPAPAQCPLRQGSTSPLTILMCHINVPPMKRTSIRELKHETRKVLALVESGETVEVRRRNQPVAVLSPAGRGGTVEKPDFAARLKEIYGDHVLESTGTDLISDARGDR